MTPQEYIAEKKSEFPVTETNEAFFESAFFKSQLKDGESAEQLKETIRNTDYAVYLFESHKNRFPEYVIELYEKGKLAFGEIDNPIPNAHFKILGELEYAITFNAGLKNFIYRIIRAYTTRFKFSEDEEKKTMKFEQSSQIIADIFWWFGVSQGQSFGPDYPITNDQMMMANILTIEAELFFLAHEVGHMNVDMIKKSSVADTYIENYGHLDEEYEADRFALLTCLGSFNPDNHDNHEIAKNDLIYAGCELALLIFDGLERIGFEIETTHPPASKRIEHLKKSLRQYCESETVFNKLTKFSQGTTVIYNKVIELISNPSIEQREYFESQAKKIMSKMSLLLDKHSNGFVPNYFEFNQEMSQLFATGYHHNLIDKLFEVGQAFFQDITKHNSSNESFNESTTKNFFKFKLLISFTGNLAEPAKGYFQQKLFGNQPTQNEQQ